jgi:FkbH-like protein
LFLDDSPIERESIRQMLPAVRVFDGPMVGARSWLLSSPCLESNINTSEAAKRTAMVQAQLGRDRARRAAPDEATFMKSLKIHLSISRIRDPADERIGRAVELSQRTNQLNTSLIRYEHEALRSSITEGDRLVYVLAAEDRFTRYGIVGLLVASGSAIETLAISCRVIVLRPALPFLRGTIRRRPPEHDAWPITASVRLDERNRVAHSVFAQAGFRQVGAGQFILDDRDQLSGFDESIYSVEFAG